MLVSAPFSQRFRALALRASRRCARARGASLFTWMADDGGQPQAQPRGALGRGRASNRRKKLPVPGVLERVFPGVTSLAEVIRTLLSNEADAPDLDTPPGSEGYRAVRGLSSYLPRFPTAASQRHAATCETHWREARRDECVLLEACTTATEASGPPTGRRSAGGLTDVLSRYLSAHPCFIRPHTVSISAPPLRAERTPAFHHSLDKPTTCRRHLRLPNRCSQRRSPGCPRTSCSSPPTRRSPTRRTQQISWPGR